jgi:hypothetical protein
MTDLERQILDALKDLEAAVASLKTAVPKPNLLPIFERLDTLRGQLPKSADPQLLHYLHKQSYEKARLWLEGREAENVEGSCRH